MATDNQINKINKRVQQIRQTFGEDSSDFRKAQEAIQTLAGDNTRTLPDGTIIIKRGKKAEAEISDEVINSLLSKPTAAQIIRRTKKAIAAEEERKPSSVTYKDVMEYDKKRSHVENFINDRPSEVYDALRVFKGDSGKPTYAELSQAIKNYEAAQRKEKRETKRRARRSHNTKRRKSK